MIANSRFSRWIVEPIWVTLFAVLPLGHVTALRNIVVVLLIALVLLTCDWRSFGKVPALLPIVLLLVFAASSAVWSASGEATLAKFRSDLFEPFAVYACAFVWSRSVQKTTPLALGTAIGLGLMLVLSLYDFLPHTVLDEHIPLASFAAVGRTLPQWYPGTGDASLLALLYATGLITWESLSERPSVWRIGVIIVAAGCILAVTKNRSSLIVAPVLVASLWGLHAQTLKRAFSGHALAASMPSPRRRTPWAWMLVLVCVVAIPVAAELFSRARLVELHEQMPASGTAFSKLAARDVRPAMWQRYTELGMAHPWFGVGFGRTVPAAAYRIKEDPVFLHTEAAGLEHAHDYLLNLWLQLGAVGLLLVLWVVGAIISRAAREASKSRAARVAFVGIVGVVLATALRNLTDDFMVYGTAIVVWAQLGWWLGVQQAPSVSEPVAHRAP